MKILVVEDERVAASFLSRGLREESFAVDVAERASEADAAVDTYDYDLILLDVMIPGESGFDLCRRWRRRGLKTPILFLTARDELSAKVEGLDIGGDDYLTKPFQFEELLARVRALVRRAAAASDGSELRIADLVIDMAGHRVQQAGRYIELSAREYQLLEFFALHVGKLVTRTNLWEHVWETFSEPESNVVDVYVRYLRNKLGRDREYIRTRRGAGYVFGDPGDKVG